MNARWFDRIIYGGAWKQIRFLIIIVVSLIVLSCLGVHWGSKYQMTPSEEMTVLATDSAANHSFQKTLWNVYNNFVDSGNLISISPEDRPWALIISLLGSVVLGGLLISTLSNIIERRVENCRNGLIHYKLSDHFVIIGADAMLPCLIRQLCQREKDCTLVIQTSKDVNEVRMELFSNLTKDEEKRIVLVHAMRDSKEELKKLYVADAKEVFILGDSGELDDVEKQAMELLDHGDVRGAIRLYEEMKLDSAMTLKIAVRQEANTVHIIKHVKTVGRLQGQKQIQRASHSRKRLHTL